MLPSECPYCKKKIKSENIKKFIEHCTKCKEDGEANYSKNLTTPYLTNSDQGGSPASPAAQRSKYNAKRTEYNGITYDSKLEASYAEYLDSCPDVRYYLRQVPFDLPGKVKYRLDFLVFHVLAGDPDCVDIKGRDTAMSKLKRKQVEALYPVKIKIIKKGQF